MEKDSKEKMKKIPPAFFPREGEEFYQELTKWAQGCGAIINKVALHDFPVGYRGMIATADIKKGEVLVSIPKSMFINCDLWVDNPTIKKIDLNNLYYPAARPLNIYLLMERTNPASKWKYVFEAYPWNTESYPTFFKEEEKSLLKGSSLLADIESYLNCTISDYDSICADAPEMTQYASKEEYLKFALVQDSRTFGLNLKDGYKTTYIPFAEFFNDKHDNANVDRNHDREAERYVFTAYQDIRAGEELTISYNHGSQYYTFLTYGFINEERDNDQVKFFVPFSPSDPLREHKESLMSEHPHYKTIRMLAGVDNKRFNKALSFFRYYCYEGTKEGLDKLKEASDNRPGRKPDSKPFQGHYIAPISLTNEKKALHTLKEVCEQELAKYPTTYEEDLKLLKGKLDYNTRNCIFYRSNEKKIFLDHISFLSKALATLALKEKKSILEAAAKDTDLQTYIDSILSLF